MKRLQKVDSGFLSSILGVLTRIRRSGIVSLLLYGIAGSLGVQIPSFAAEALHLTSRPLIIPELGEVTSYVLQKGTSIYRFLPPPLWQVRLNAAEQRVDLTRPDIGANMWFRFVASTNVTNELKPDLLSARVQQIYPGSKVHEEFICNSGLGSGPGFDLVRALTNGTTYSTQLNTRLAFIPTGPGLIEFSFTAPASRSDKDHFVFGNLLTSFQDESAKGINP